MEADFEDLLAPEIVAALERGATVVTGNQRAARTLRREFDRRNRARGLRSWQPAKAVAWDTWVSGWWSRLVMEGRVAQMLLNRSQELAVWRGILEADEGLEGRRKDSLAEMAAEAWRLLSSYNGLGFLRGPAVGTDARAFQGWARGFERRCWAEGLLARAGLEDALRRSVTAGDLDVGEWKILLVGFDSLTPAQAGLVDALRAAGARVEELRVVAPVGRRMLVSAEAEGEELRACARWVRGFLEERSDGRVAVIVPGLAGEQAEIERVFREVLAPELEDIGVGMMATPFEFSVGVALSATSMVAAAMNLLRWAKRALSLDRVSGLLLSPYFAEGRVGPEARARLDAFALRRTKLLRPEVSLEELGRVVERSRGDGLGELKAALRGMAQVVARRFGRDEARSHAKWAEAMRELLSAAGWGAGSSEDSVEFQTRAKWESALDELTTLDFDGVRVEFEEALLTLEKIAGRMMFAPESHGAQVQVMGPLEAAGSHFDAVWFLRAGELSWPMEAQGNPLLPWQVRRDLGMPGGDAARELAFARRVTERIAESAGTVMFSYARHGGEETVKQRASAALRGIVLEEIDAARILMGDMVREIVAAEMVEDDVELPPLPDRVIRGGAALLAAQAACGFKAFAEQRLWSSEPETGELGMDAAQRGTVVHRVLERFWKNVKTQEELKTMSADERNEVLDWCIGQELPAISRGDDGVWELAYLDMERRRLHNLLGEWLELELERAPFEVKLSEERFDDVRVGPLRLRIIVDRVDLVEGDVEGAEPAEVILDYKTGRVEPKDWLSERPNQPQLPLYAVMGDAPRIAGVAFAKVRLGDEMGLHGYATRGELLTKTDRLKEAATLEEQIGAWKIVLTRLAEEFAAGDVRVRPKQYPQTCEYCAQRLVCRLDAAALEAEADEESEGSGE
jgi:ATP-dependent helicase/nuclease subunit B